MNPVTIRELLGAFRTPRSLVLLLVPAIITSILVIMQWPTDAVVARSGNRALNVFSLFGYSLIGVVCLLTPVYPAVSLVKERIRGTLELMFHTPLSRFRIFIGKLLGAISPMGLSLTMTLPAAAACYAMGGITFQQHLLPLYLVLILAVSQLATMSLLVSSHSKNIDSAVRTAYSLMLLMVIGCLGPFQVLQGSESQLKVTIAKWIRHASPLPAIIEIMGDSGFSGQGMVSNSSSVKQYLIMGSFTLVVMAFFTIQRLHIRIFDVSRASGTMTEDRSLFQRFVRRFIFLIDPQRRSWSIGNWTNPILIKEFRCRRFGRASWILRLIAICAVASIALTYFAATGVKSWTVELIGSLLVIFQMALIVLLAPGMSASLLASEVESGGWTMLRMSPQSSFSIAFGKLASVAWPMLLALMATVPGYLLMIYLKPVLKQQVILVVASLLLSAIFTVIASAAIGSFFKRNTPATIASYVILTALTVLPILIWMGRDAPFGFQFVENSLLINPMSSALSIMRTTGFEPYRLVPYNWIFLGCGSVIGFVLFWIQIIRLNRPD